MAHDRPHSARAGKGSFRPAVLRAAVAASVTACIAAPAHTAPTAQAATELVVGVSHVPPAYRAGAKFRTPESMESALADDIAQRRATRAILRKTNGRDREGMFVTNDADLLFLSLAPHDALQRSANFIPTGYAAGPMAILRTDTSIRTWEQLKGRIVCVTENGPYAGMPARRYGAIEKRFAAPADSLLALRIGGCDAAVHDSVLLEELIRLPEWKKFSARLPAGPAATLGIYLPRADASTRSTLQAIVADWRQADTLRQLNSKRARQVAFEVYLDQDVPDCH